MNQRFGRDGAALRVRGPFLDRTHLRGAAAGLDDRTFEIGRRPLRDRRGDALFVLWTLQHSQRRRAMMWRIRMQAYPAILRPIVAGNRIPYRRQRPTDRTQR